MFGMRSPRYVVSADAQVRERRRTSVASSFSSLKKNSGWVRSGLFLKGPIPWVWLAKAAVLPGHALHVALVLWLERGFSGDRDVRLIMVRTRELGMSRFSVYRALDALEAAELITADRVRGRCARVSILDVAENTSRARDAERPAR